MTYAAKPLDPCTGVDTIYKFDPQSAARIKDASVLGQPCAFAWRYVGLGAPSPYDCTPAERDAILGAGLALLLVQHAHGPDGHPWEASAAQGHADAAHAVTCAQAAGYLAGCSLAFDLEDCRSVGQPVLDHVTTWAESVRAAGYSPVLYVGYAAGLSAAQLASLPFDAYWSDAGNRSVAPPKAFACKQHLQMMAAGIGIDPDEILGPGLVGMVIDAGDAVAPDPGDPVDPRDLPTVPLLPPLPFDPESVFPPDPDATVKPT